MPINQEPGLWSSHADWQALLSMDPQRARLEGQSYQSVPGQLADIRFKCYWPFESRPSEQWWSWHWGMLMFVFGAWVSGFTCLCFPCTHTHTHKHTHTHIYTYTHILNSGGNPPSSQQGTKLDSLLSLFLSALCVYSLPLASLQSRQLVRTLYRYTVSLCCPLSICPGSLGLQPSQYLHWHP